MPDTFISYRREDSAGYAGRLRDSLERRLGHARIFRDVDTLQPGQDFVRAIDERVRQCRVFVALIGREWLDARDPAGHRRIDQEEDHVRLEIATALGRDDLLVVPVLVEGAPMPASRDLPASIRSLAFRHAISLRDETWDADVDRLAAVAGVQGEVGPSLARPVPDATPAPQARAALLSSVVLGTAAIVVALLLVFGRPGADPPGGRDTRERLPDAHGDPPGAPDTRERLPDAQGAPPAAPDTRGRLPHAPGDPANPAAGVPTPRREARPTPSPPGTAASRVPGATTPTPPAATSGRRDGADLDRLEVEIDQLHTRFVAVEQSLVSLREQQARAGLALRSDMTARHEAARGNLGRARDAVSAGDLDRARRFTELAAADLQVLEQFLSR